MDVHNARAWRRWIVIVGFLLASGLLFLASLCFSTYYAADPGNSGKVSGMLGVLALGLGWFSGSEGLVPWLANPLLVIVWVLMLIPRTRFIGAAGAVVALALALSFLTHKDILLDEGGSRGPVVGYGPGYWLWIASMVTAGVGCVVGALV